MAKASAQKKEPVVKDEDHRSKHEDTIGTPDVQNTPPDPVDIPDEDAKFTDPDDAELAAAEAAAAEEAAGKAPDGTPAQAAQEPSPTGDQQVTQPEPVAEPAAEPAPDAAQPAQSVTSGDDPMIPKGRFDEVLREKAQLEQQNLYLKGVTDAQRAMIGDPRQSQGQPAQPAQQTATEQIAAVRNERLQAAQKYEAGEITLPEYQAAADKAEDAILTIRDNELRRLQTQPQQQQTDRRAQEDLYLQERTAKIAADHPYIEKIGDGDLNYIIGKARNELGFGTRALETAAEVLALRQKVGEMSDTLGPVMLGETGQPATPAAQTPTPANQPGQMSQAAMQRQTKLEMQANHPPDVTTMGNAATPNGEPSAEEIARMTDEEIIARLPESTQNRIMGIR